MSSSMLPASDQCTSSSSSSSRNSSSSMVFRYGNNNNHVNSMVGELERPVTPPVRGNLGRHGPVLIRPEAVRPLQLVLREQEVGTATSIIVNNYGPHPSPSRRFVDRNEGARHPEPAEDGDIINNKMEKTCPSIAILLDLFRKRSRDESEENVHNNAATQLYFPKATKVDAVVHNRMMLLPLLIKPIAMRAVDVAQCYYNFEDTYHPSQSVPTKNSTVDMTPMRVCG
jgi:hypothetical protein